MYPSNPQSWYAFKIFKGVRNLAFYTYDLPVSAIPFKIDVSSKEDICTIFNELLDKYNNNTTAKKLFEAIGSLLGATVYNKEENVIFGGRLGEYKYYDMDKVIEVALGVVAEELSVQ